MAKFPYLSGRKGSQNLYYKRMVPLELRGAGRPAQIWRSLKTADRKAAERAYAGAHAEVELQFAQWRKEERGSTRASASPADALNAAAPLTPGLLRRLADAHYLGVYDDDFRWRGDLWKQAHESEEAFWRGDIIRLPSDDWAEFKGKQYSYFARLMEEPVLEDVFLYAVFRERQRRLRRLQRSYKLGDGGGHRTVADALLCARGLSLCDADHRRLVRKLMETEIKALEDLGAGSEIAFDNIMDRNAEASLPQTSSRTPPAEMFSNLVEKYLDETSRAREWPLKTILRKRSDLREFMEIAGDKPVNAYVQPDGIKFKDIQLALPINRQKPPFKGLSRIGVAEKATKLRKEGKHVDLLNPITIKDKLGTVALFFTWAKACDSSVVNPVAEQRVQVRRNKRGGKKRHPWTIEELNLMFAAPVFTGCRSSRHWKEPGEVVLRDSAKYWVPLIALFSGLRLGEIIQMQVADVKMMEGIGYFDVTTIAVGDKDDEGYDPAEEKSLKTASSRRAVPIHKSLLDLGFEVFLDTLRANGEARLFPEFGRAEDDGSWSKQFSKYFKRFRESIGVSRRGVKFHSL
ncbi:MAG: site-specific integrase, partial [Hyphomicrobium sp.]